MLTHKNVTTTQDLCRACELRETRYRQQDFTKVGRKNNKGREKPTKSRDKIIDLLAENDLVRFFKEYMPRYGYKHLCTEDDDYKYYQTLNLPCIKRGIMGRHCNYGAPLRDVDV